MRLTQPTAAIAVILTGLNIATISYSGEEGETDAPPIERERLALHLSLEKLNLQLDEGGANGEDRRSAVAAWHASKSVELDALATSGEVAEALHVSTADPGAPPVPSGKSAEEFLVEASQFKSDAARRIWTDSLEHGDPEDGRLALARHVHSEKMTLLDRQMEGASGKIAKAASVKGGGNVRDGDLEVSEEISAAVGKARIRAEASGEDPRFRIAALETWVDEKLREDAAPVSPSPAAQRKQRIKQLDSKQAPR